MAKRFQETVQIGQVDVSSGARGFLSLADRLESFDNQTVSLGQTVLAASRAKDAAEQKITDAQQKERAVHNKAIRDAHIASINNDNRESIARIESENPSDLITFNENAEGYRKGVLAGVDPSLRLIVEQDLDNKITSSRIRVQDKAIKSQKAQADSDLLSNFESASAGAFRDMRNGDKESASTNLQEAIASIDSWGQANPGNDEKVAKMKRDVERETAEQGFKKQFADIVDNQGIDEALDELDKRSKKVPRGWTPDEWDRYTKEQQSVLNQKLAKQEAQTKEDAKAAKLNLSIERGRLFLNPNIPADPAKSSQDRKDVNAAYEADSAAWVGLPIQQQIDNNVEFIKNSGIVPDSVISIVNASMRSGNTEQATIASDLIGRLEESPNAANVLRDIPDESRALSKQITDSIRSGIDPDQAIEIARKNTFGLTTQQKEAIKINSQAVAKELPSFLLQQVDEKFDPSSIPFFGEEPDVPVDMQADYNVAFGSFMTLTNGNPEQSKALAFESLQKNWAITDVGGENRFMKHAPEAYYSVDGFDNDWIDRQFLEDMEIKGVPGAQLGTDFNTGRSNTPSYPIIVTNEQGIPDIARDEETGLPLRWQPDFKETTEYGDAISAPDLIIENAKKKRKRKLVARANTLRRKVDHSIFRQLNDVNIFTDPPTPLGATDKAEAAKIAISNLFAREKIDIVEFKELNKAYGVTE